MHTLFEMLYEYMPTPQDMYDGERIGEHPDTGDIEVRKVGAGEPFSAIVFKTIFDPFVGKISVFKVNSGKARKDSEVLNSSKGKKERLSSLFFIRGKNQLDAQEVSAGDICATTKLQFTQTGDTICDKENPIKYPELNLPKPSLYLAVEPKSKDDEEKISESFQKLSEEDPTFVISRNYETKQLLIGGQGEKQLQIITHKLENNFGVSVSLSEPKVAYRETIKGSVEVQGKHKKQTGGSGQYGDVYIKFEPSSEEFEFVEKIHGGSVPKQYIPAVKKGLMESMKKGVLAGYPVMNVKATILDGSYHSVDSNELSFKLAAQLAFRKGIPDAKPIMLEPIVKVEITIPDVYTGEVMGDMNKRRGRILGMEPIENQGQKVLAEVPEREMFNYVSDLRSMTQARGYFSMEFDRYEEIPHHLAQKIIKSEA